MLVLGIESSCDDTGLALIDTSRVIASKIASQIQLHALFGGVVPELASREHARLIGPLQDALFNDAKISLRDVTHIAVTRGPGLMGSLLVGLNYAKALSFVLQKPLIGVNHLHAHLLVAGMEHKLIFPALGVLVSGGHTHLIRMESPTNMIVMGKTLDDAAGEACDKFGKMLGLPYPGGAYLDSLGQMGTVHPRLFPRPYTKNNTLDFSFSGLKTAGLEWVKKNPEALLPSISLQESYTREVLQKASQISKDGAASYLYAVADTLTIKAKRALESFDPQCIVVAGGVAANSFVRGKFTELANNANIPLYIPSIELCTDNAIMIAHTGLLLAKEGFYHDLNLTAVARGKIIPNDYQQI